MDRVHLVMSNNDNTVIVFEDFNLAEKYMNTLKNGTYFYLPLNIAKTPEDVKNQTGVVLEDNSQFGK